jgi:hypothetical protein
MARRFRFSIRTLAIVVAFFCAYLSTWESTRRFAASHRKHVLSPNGIELFSLKDPNVIEKMSAHLKTKSSFIDVADCWSPAPLVIARMETDAETMPLRSIRRRVRYYLWFFGPMLKLPFEWEWGPPL